MPDLLLEILSEEMPSHCQNGAETALANTLKQELQKANLPFESIQTFSTPRRLASIVKQIPEKQCDSTVNRKGPNIAANAIIIKRFLQSIGLETVDQCQIQKTKKGSIYYVQIHKKGRASDEILPDIILRTIKKIPWSQSMRFANDTFRWIRPLKNIVATFGEKILSGRLDLGSRDLSFTGATKGHEILDPGPHQVRADTYETTLTNASVIGDRNARRTHIERQLNRHAKTLDSLYVKDEALLCEVVGLVEYPIVLVGKIDKNLMALPREVLITSMRKHQKFFVFQDKSGALAPYFATVANIQTTDGGASIVKGNERVLRARLKDSLFFWESDLAMYPKNAMKKLEDMTFHTKLGTVFQRARRLEKLANHLAPLVEANAQDVRRAAHLCKVDIVSKMVGEFPELQGVIGKYYAQNSGENTRVCQAIAEQYMPNSRAETCPTAPESLALALADKLEMMTAFWSIDERPTSSKDPYALRRCAVGILRLILENNLSLSLRTSIVYAFSLQTTPKEFFQENLVDNMLQFFHERAKIYLKTLGMPADYSEAVLSSGIDHILTQVRLIETLSKRSAAVSALKNLFMRVKNITHTKSHVVYQGIRKDLFQKTQEKTLFDAIDATKKIVSKHMKNKDFDAAIDAILPIQEKTDRFFDAVMVNSDDKAIRDNRRTLLKSVIDLLAKIVNFDAIAG